MKNRERAEALNQQADGLIAESTRIANEITTRIREKLR